ncbi:Gfo/Idh/MocA family oxidoreductase, partial [Kineococcus arenarius]|uniref:Gfo/Idh/MocA family oxidoreductase n=1 Tax=Kineococcus sp. SYSU DK019 TaxID=3383140 RepID=UPI003D7DB1D8
MNDAPRRFGVLGTGHWARTCHGAALAAHPDVELVGFAGRDPARAAAVAEQVGGRAFASPEELIEQVDAVTIALPPHVQAPLGGGAGRGGGPGGTARGAAQARGPAQTWRRLRRQPATLAALL